MPFVVVGQRDADTLRFSHGCKQPVDIRDRALVAIDAAVGLRGSQGYEIVIQMPVGPSAPGVLRLRYSVKQCGNPSDISVNGLVADAMGLQGARKHGKSRRWFGRFGNRRMDQYDGEISHGMRRWFISAIGPKLVFNSLSITVFDVLSIACTKMCVISF